MQSLPCSATLIALCTFVVPALLTTAAGPHQAEDADECRAGAEGCDLASLLQVVRPLGWPAATQPQPQIEEDGASDGGAGEPLRGPPENKDGAAQWDEEDGGTEGPWPSPPSGMREDHGSDGDKADGQDDGAGGPWPGPPSGMLADDPDMDGDGEADEEDVGSVQPQPAGSDEAHGPPQNPLQELVGTWESTGGGLNVVALPQHKGGHKITADFILWVQNMTERLTVRRMAPVTNRGYWHADHRHPPRQENQHLKGVRYEQTVWKAGKEGRRGRVIHEENGMWFYNAVPGVDKGWTVERQAVIATGAVFMMLGENCTIRGLAALEEDLRSELSRYQTLPATGGPPDERYLSPYLRRHDPAVLRPVERLLATLAEDAARPNHSHVETVKLRVSTRSPLGGFLDTRPGVRVQAPNKDFEASVWLQTWTDGAGRVVRRQLQYAQGVHMFFRVQFNEKCELLPHQGCLIDWPHVQVDTLVKVPGHQPDEEDDHGPGKPGSEPSGHKPGGEDGDGPGKHGGEPGGRKPGEEDGHGPSKPAGEPAGHKPDRQDGDGPGELDGAPGGHQSSEEDGAGSSEPGGREPDEEDGDELGKPGGKPGAHKTDEEDGHGPGKPGGKPLSHKPGEKHGQGPGKPSSEPGGRKPSGEDGHGPGNLGGEPGGYKLDGEDDHGSGEPGGQQSDGEDGDGPGEPGGEPSRQKPNEENGDAPGEPGGELGGHGKPGSNFGPGPGKPGGGPGGHKPGGEDGDWPTEPGGEPGSHKPDGEDGHAFSKPSGEPHGHKAGGEDPYGPGKHGGEPHDHKPGSEGALAPVNGGAFGWMG